jgi:16S rRNA (guanine527-N7)-methyltransferase
LAVSRETVKGARHPTPSGVEVSRETRKQGDALSVSPANVESIAKSIGIDARERVARWLGETRLRPRGGFLERVEKFAATLALWGPHTNLTADAGDPAEIAFHIIDSLAPFAFASDANRDALEAALAEGGTTLDLGSGAGFPGIVLAAAFAGRFTLVESRRKRASFLQVAAHQMALDNVAIEQRRASARTVACGFDLVTARAFGVSVELYEIAAAALRPGGMLLLFESSGQASSAQDLAERDLGQSLDARQARAEHFREPATWHYRLPHRERVADRTAALWCKHRAG